MSESIVKNQKTILAALRQQTYSESSFYLLVLWFSSNSSRSQSQTVLTSASLISRCILAKSCLERAGVQISIIWTILGWKLANSSSAALTEAKEATLASGSHWGSLSPVLLLQGWGCDKRNTCGPRQSPTASTPTKSFPTSFQGYFNLQMAVFGNLCLFKAKAITKEDELTV